MMRLLTALLYLFFLIASLPACGDDVGNDDATASGENHDGHDDHGHGHDDHGHEHDPNEVMTTVVLSFTTDGGEASSFTWADPEQDGMPVVDGINLSAGETYTVTIQVLNELVDPVGDVTIELRDELDEHQFFFTGSAVSSPAHENDDAIITQAYTDQDAHGFPVGLTNTITANEAGMGTLNIMLRHMPRVNNELVKTGELADLVKNGDIASLPGNVDIEISFDVTVE